MQKLTGRVACITGAGAGMGRAHALMMAEQGAAVVVQDIAGERAEETASQIRSTGGTAHVAICDVADRKDLRALILQ